VEGKRTLHCINFYGNSSGELRNGSALY